MSVLIKDMRMPQSCRQCRMMTIYYNRPHCAAKDGMILTTPIEYDNILTYPYRHENCPLVEVDETVLDEWNKVYPDGEEVTE